MIGLRTNFRIGCLLAATLINSGAALEGAEVSQQLEVSVRSTKAQLGPGDRITIIGTLRNAGIEPTTVFKRRRLYSTLHVKIFDNRQQPMKSFRLLIFEPAAITTNDFVELKRSDETTMSFYGALKSQTIRDIESAGRVWVQGLFLNFEDSAILLNGPGQYELRFSYEVSKEMADEWTKAYGFNALWRGTTLSKPIFLTVR